MATIFLVLLYLTGVIVSIAWAYKQRRNMFFWAIVAVCLSPIVALICLAFGGVGRAFDDGKECASAGFLKYRPDWKTAQIRCPSCNGSGQSILKAGDLCPLCRGRKTSRARKQKSLRK